MEANIIESPLVVIVGPTASGKTSLSIDLAKRHKGEIICADSRTIYKGMDIGTAKPSVAEQAMVPHWGLDLVEPGEYFSVADFKAYAYQKIKEIRSRGNVPFLVGGTGLYIDAILFDYKFGAMADNSDRIKLQHMTLDQLHIYCNKNNISLPDNYKNKRYVIRSIENQGVKLGKRQQPLSNSIIVGISTEKTILRNRIEQRIEQLFNDGVINEVEEIGGKYGWGSEALKSNIYPLVHSYLTGDMTLADVKLKSITADWRLAKRQMTWLRRNKFIQWLLLRDAEEYLDDQLAIYK